MPVDDAVLYEAASIEPTRLRSLDSIHLATALSIRDDIGAFLTYDDRLAEAGGEHGLNVVRSA